MEEKKQSKRGGKRNGAGRPPKSDSKKQIAIKLDRDLYDIFKAPPFSKDADGLNRGRYINEAIREKMEREFDRNIVTNIYLEEINKIINTQR